jgi:DNA-binding NarL/FixJ family response regulator
LSLREKEVFPLLADGLNIKEIADRLYISPKTVETHKYNIMEKLGARSLADLTKLAIKKGLIKP